MLNISKQIFCGWKLAPASGELPEAEIVPMGTTTNEKSRVKKISKSYTNTVEHDNIPLPGFTLYSANRARYGSADQTWLIIDPRGFMHRITNKNLEDILHVTGITEGLIQEKCVWARQDSATKLSLIPVSSELYVTATTNTEILENKVKASEVQIGDKVLLQSGEEGIYMGTHSLYGPMTETKARISPQTYVRRQIIEVDPGKYYYQTDVKMLKILDKTATPLTKDEAITQIRSNIDAGISYFANYPNASRSGYYSVYGMITAISANAVPKPILTLEEIDIAEAQALYATASTINDIGVLLMEEASGKKFVIEFPYGFGSARIASDYFEAKPVSWNPDDPTHFMNIETRSYTSRFYSSGSGAQRKLDNFKKFYKIVKNVKDMTYV